MTESSLNTENLPLPKSYDDLRHEQELEGLAIYVGNECDRLCLLFKQGINTKPNKMVEKKGKRQDGIIVGALSILFEYKNSNQVFLYNNCEPSLKIFLDDFLRHMETVKLYFSDLSGLKIVYIFLNNKFSQYDKYLAVEINDLLFSQSNLIEDGRVIYHLKNPCVKSLIELLNSNKLPKSP